jgi:hypothetical protein
MGICQFYVWENWTALDKKGNFSSRKDAKLAKKVKRFFQNLNLDLMVSLASLAALRETAFSVFPGLEK